MKNIWISLMVFCGLTAYSSYAIQHNLFYGHCTYDNNTIPIYTQVISMENSSSNQVEPKPVQRRWYESITSIFRRSPTTTPAPPASTVNRNVINATVVFPPAGHHNNQLIKCIQVIDNIRDGTGALASIIEGGMNLNHTKILLKSQPGAKIDSKVTIFAYRTPEVPPHQEPAPSPNGWKAAAHYPQQPLPTHPLPPPQHQPSQSYYPWPNVHKKK